VNVNDIQQFGMNTLETTLKVIFFRLPNGMSFSMNKGSLEEENIQNS